MCLVVRVPGLTFQYAAALSGGWLRSCYITSNNMFVSRNLVTTLSAQVLALNTPVSTLRRTMVTPLHQHMGLALPNGRSLYLHYLYLSADGGRLRGAAWLSPATAVTPLERSACPPPRRRALHRGAPSPHLK
jgi:hypothetical protein